MNNIAECYPLSAMQEGMIFHSLQAPRSGVYIQQLVCDLHHQLNIRAFEGACERLVARHAVLRTKFRWSDQARPIQEVHRHVELPLEHLSWSHLSHAEQTARNAKFLQADRLCGFQLEDQLPVRLAMITLSETEFRFILTFHHALLDGRSCRVLMEELFTIYEAFAQGTHLSLAEIRPFHNFIDRLESLDLGPAENFWRTTLAGFDTPTPFRVDHRAAGAESNPAVGQRVAELPSAEHRRNRGAITSSSPARPGEGTRAGEDAFGKQKVHFCEEVTSALKLLAKAQGITPNTVFQGAWAFLLSVYSGERDVVFGATRACRRSLLPEAESMVGLFINTLPLRVQVSPDSRLLPWLAAIRQEWVAMRDYEHTPLVKIQEWSSVPAGRPLFESVLVFEEYQLSSSLQALGGSWAHRECWLRGMTNYPLTVSAYLGDEFLVEIAYLRSRFDDDVVRRIAAYFQVLLQEIVADPDRRLADLPILTDGERHRLLTEWNDTAVEYPKSLCLHQLVEAQAARTPRNVAVVSTEGPLTYEELNGRANQLARRLQELGVGPEIPVAVCVTRRLEMVVGLLGTFKAGGAYLPLDPADPADRLQFILGDAKVKVLLTEQSLLPRLRDHATSVVCLDAMGDSNSAAYSEKPVCAVRSDHLAYVIYTSGSTGRPKGVLVTHRALVNQTLAAVRYFGITPADRRLQFAPLSFDVSAAELFSTLVSGATVVLWSGASAASLQEFLDFIDNWKLTIVSLPTSYWHELVSELSQANVSLPPCLRLLIVGTEEALPQRLAQWRQLVGEDVRWCNAYGPTECTITSTIYEPEDGQPLCGPVPIGRPVDNTEIFLLDQRLNLVPIGAAGEIYIGGDGLARGYLNRPELTAESFILHPFRQGTDARLFRTGDLARYLPDGNLEFLGRVDRQVKIRGFRVELGEVERALSQHPAVRNCVVVVDQVDAGSQLTAFLVAEPTVVPAAGELRRHLANSLPEYMIPAFFVMLSEMPLDSNGKIDRSRLRGRRHRVMATDGHAAPRNALEFDLKAIWEEILGVKPIGVSDNFFELGGHSLLAFRIAARVQRATGRNLTPSLILRAPTIRLLAESLTGEDVPAAESVRSVPHNVHVSSRAPRQAAGDRHLDQPQESGRQALNGLSEFKTAPASIIVHDPVGAGALDVMEAAKEPADWESEFLFRELPDKRRYAAQHLALVNELRRHVPEVVYLHELAAHDESYRRSSGNPNQVFTRDSIITLPWAPEGYIKSRMKPELRRSESSTMEAALKTIGMQEILRVPEQLFLEGGDVIPFSREGWRTLLVGYGPRTSYETLEFLMDALIPQYADEILGIELANWRMNLDGGFVPVAEDVVVSDRNSIVRVLQFDSRGRQSIDLWEMLYDLDVKIIDTTREESVFCQACNCLCLGDRKVIYYDLCERVNDLLQQHDVETYTVPGSELVKGRGGPRCMTRPIYR